MTRRQRTAYPLLAALVLLAALLGASACGYSSDSTEVVEGEPVELGELHYNAVFSRFLNPNDNEDSAYLVGQPQAPPGSSYFGVFFEIENESDSPQTLPDSLTIIDSEHEKFEVVPSESLYALPLGGEVEAEEQIPVLDSTAQQGPIEGSLAIFLLPDSASENRPLTLEIPGPGGPAEVTLDL
ncbi:MAG TPA: hypothetical protein VIE64_00960 [Solirubrobacterales bacterium]|jgi:hypothetical protein